MLFLLLFLLISRRRAPQHLLNINLFY